MFKHKISIVAPAYNEEGCIEKFIRRVDKTLKENHLHGEIIIVNDASKDRTLQIVKSLQKEISNLRVITHSINKGLTAGLITGIENSRYDYIYFTSSDLESYPEEDIPKLLKPLNEGYDFSIGWRKNKRQGFLKTCLSKTFNFVSGKMFNIKLHDLGWIKAFKKEIYYNVESLRADWHRYFAVLAANQGYKIKEVPTIFHSRKKGRSAYGKIGLKRIPGGVFDLIVIKFLLSFSKKPMRIFGALGSLMTFGGFASGVYLLYLNYIVYGSVMDRIPLIMLTILLFLTGLQLFVMGFLAELIVSNNERRRQFK